LNFNDIINQLGDVGDSMSVQRKWSERSSNKSVDFPEGNSSASSTGGIVVVHDPSSTTAAQLPPWIVPPDDASAAENRHVESTLQKLRDMPSVAPIIAPATPGASAASSSNKIHNGSTLQLTAHIDTIEYKPVPYSTVDLNFEFVILFSLCES
jgi:hypothetical protein